ncbi:hypothetical protein Tco_1533772 [Tanacetum coccineum]
MGIGLDALLLEEPRVKFNTVQVTLAEIVLKDLSLKKRKVCIKSDFVQQISILQGINQKTSTHSTDHYTEAKDIWEHVKMNLEGFELTKDLQGISDIRMNLNTSVKSKEKPFKDTMEQDTTLMIDVDDVTENDLALKCDDIFEADEILHQTTRINPFEEQDQDAFEDNMELILTFNEHEMQNDVQHNYVVDSDADYTSDSNIIPYDQYVEDNEEHVVQCNASSVRNDALMSIFDEMHEQGVQSRLANKSHMVVNDSVTSELARYKELVGEYEKRAKFELTDRERKIDEQMRIIISDRNRKETSLKSELHSAQILLSSTVGPNNNQRRRITLIEKTQADLLKPKGNCPDTMFVQDPSVWKATGKLFADIGYQWRPTGKKLTLGKLDCGSQWRPTGRTGHALVSGLRLFKTYDGKSFKAHEFCEKNHRDQSDSE